jgi:hypothetical protein
MSVANVLHFKPKITRGISPVPRTNMLNAEYRNFADKLNLQNFIPNRLVDRR